MGWLNWLQNRLEGKPPEIPELLWQVALLQLPFLGHLSSDDLRRLKSLTERLLDIKPFAGRRGFMLTDEMAVLIATQASLLVLNLSLDLYNDMSAVIVTPDALPIRQQVMDENGIVHEWDEMLAGEAVDMGGAVLLSWRDIIPTAMNNEGTLPHNIVIHEFAHKLDMGWGGANGYPRFLSPYHSRADFITWPQVFGSAYDDFCLRVEQLEAALPADFDPENALHAQHYDALVTTLPMDPYAASDPAEFFAVVSEAFFVAPSALCKMYPDVYLLLVRYYRQDPRPRTRSG